MSRTIRELEAEIESIRRSIPIMTPPLVEADIRMRLVALETQLKIAFTLQSLDSRAEAFMFGRGIRRVSEG